MHSQQVIEASRAGSRGKVWLQGGMVAGAIALTAFLFRDVPWEDVAELLERTWPVVGLALLPHLVAMTVETFGWQRALGSAGHRVSYGGLLVVRIVTESLGQLLPGGAVVGETVKPALLRRRCALAFSVGVGTTVHRKYLRLMAHGIYVAGAVILGLPAIQRLSVALTGTPRLDVVLGLSAVVLSGGALLLGGMGRGGVALRVFAILQAIPLRRLRVVLRRLRRGFETADRETVRLFQLPAQSQVVPVLACVGAWLCEALESWLLLQILGVDIDFSTVLAFDVAISLARQTMVFLPAGVGVQDVGYFTALAALGVPGAAIVGVAFVLLKRQKELVWGLIGGALLAPELRWWFRSRVAARPVPAA